MKPLRAADFKPEEAHAPEPPAAAIRVRDVSKAYKLYREPRDLLWEALTGRSRHTEKVVLKDISFEIPKGEVVGIIGANGAGKSTLLKMIAGTLQPSTGSIAVDGKIAAILELGTGFNPNYSGRENVILSGMLRGMSEQDIRRKFDSIVAFSGLEAVIDQPFHTYSSGMQARLAFATAVSVDADIIIIDEALAAGDVRFTSKSLRRIREISESGITCLFVSHVTYQIMQLCSRAIWIDSGRMRMDGPAIDVVRAYEYEMHRLIAEDRGDQPTPAEPVDLAGKASANPHLENAAASPLASGGAAPSPAAETTTRSSEVAENGRRTEPPESPIGEAALSSGAAPPPESFDRMPGDLTTDRASGPTNVIQPQSPTEQTSHPLERPQAAEPDALSDEAPASASGPDAFEADPIREALPAPASIAEEASTSSNPSIEPATSDRAAEDVSSKPALSEAALSPSSENDHRTGQYRITRLELLDEAGRETKVFRFGDVVRLRVGYERLTSEPPDGPCRLAVTFERTSDSEPVMHFDFEIPHSGAEIGNGDSSRAKDRKGLVEARIEPLQLCSGEYQVSLGILPDRARARGLHQDLQGHCQVTVLPSGFPEPSVFYPLVRWRSGDDRR